ncbi:glycosyltransferase [Candidatus Margulisiibacteriota bacterium]
MYDDKSKQFCNQFILQSRIDVDLYKKYVGDDFIEELKELAKPLKGKTWLNVNSTCVGGGVAELLYSVVPFAKGLGINCRWYVMEGVDEFFTVTKKFHNLLQGLDVKISLEEIFSAYLDTVQKNLKDKKLIGDMIIIHDPQPAAAIMSGNILGNVLWRCHIDTSEANEYIWRFLLPYVNQYDGAIFTSQDYIKDGIHIPTYAVPPAIDPFTEKNFEITDEEAYKNLEPLYAKHNIDAKRPMILAVSRYDIHKNQKAIIQAFKKAKTDKVMQKMKPILIIVGNSASDDPEGAEMYKEILVEIDNDPDIYPLVNIEDNDKNISALLKVAKGFVHVPTKEGFGLVVTEALWHGTPVIGSSVGGVKQQIIDGENGFLVQPHEVDKIALYIRNLLEDETGREIMSDKAIKHVKYNFLLPTLVKKYVLLMRYYLEIDNELPEFRINDLTFKEIKRSVYSRKAWHFSIADLKQKIERDL